MRPSPDPLRVIHGRILKSERRRRLLTTRELAALARVHPNSVVAAEHGKAGEKVVRAIVIALADVDVPSIEEKPE